MFEINVFVNFLIVSSQLNAITFIEKVSNPKKIFIRLPFLGALSLQIRNEMKSFLRKHTNDKALVYVVDILSKVG